MSNEELVARIQTGESCLMVNLWEQVSGLVRWKANRVMTSLELQRNSCGVEFDDLCQCGYLALVAAVADYRPGGGSFNTLFMFRLKTAFAEATGLRTKRQLHDPLRWAVSLDMPVGEDEETNFSELIPDPAAEVAITAVADTEMQKQCSEAMHAAMTGLSDSEVSVIDCRYFRGMSLPDAATTLGITAKEAKKLESNALRYLRHPDRARKLREFWG